VIVEPLLLQSASQDLLTASWVNAARRRFASLQYFFYGYATMFEGLEGALRWWYEGLPQAVAQENVTVGGLEEL
jgi:hypothetical protein